MVEKAFHHFIMYYHKNVVYFYCTFTCQWLLIESWDLLVLFYSMQRNEEKQVSCFLRYFHFLKIILRMLSARHISKFLDK